MKAQIRIGGGIRRHNFRVTSSAHESDRSARPSLRERKRRRLLSEIQRTALKLFTKQGYEETTIEQIAEAVEVSPSTIFRYFPTKEDLILSDEYDPLILEALASGPPGETPVAAVRRALTGNLKEIVDQDASLFLTRGRLMLGVPELRARLWDFLHQNEAALAGVFAAHAGRDPKDFELRVAAGAIIGAIMAAMTEWVETDGKADMVQLVDRALHQLEVGLADVSGRPAS
jgi:AcrR family transcriptional regulator